LLLTLGLASPQWATAQQMQTINLGDRTHQVAIAGTLGISSSEITLLGGAPPNDLCANAEVVELVTGVPVTRLGDNTGATDEFGFGNSVWEAFTITECQDVTVAYCGTDPAFSGANNLLFVGCPLVNLVFNASDNVNPFVCGDGNFSILFPGLPAGTYYYAVAQGGGATGAYELTFTAAACSAIAPDNTVCNGAIALTPSPGCAPLFVDAAGATSGESLPAIVCSGFTGDAGDDVWFSFVATAEEHTIIVDPSDVYDVVIDLRAGDCDSNVSIACEDIVGQGGAETLVATGLTIGTTYYVRVYDWYAGAPLTSTFEICLLGPEPSCTAEAGGLTADLEDVCMVAGNATLSATPDGDAVVPAGYEVVYALSEGAGLVLIDGNDDPIFTVTGSGNYTIHTLVYDPATLDLDLVEFGVTTGFDLNDLLIQGGGAICAALDVTGASFTVTGPDAGTLTAEEAACFEGEPVTLTAIANGDEQVPAGYEVIYVLTEGAGLVIIDVNADPEFEVDATGSYTIHTLVYDPATLDLSIVELGVTTGFDVNGLLVQGGGEICASLDVAGAAFSVLLCCDAVAGTLTAEAVDCYDGEALTLTATPDGNIEVPADFEVIYVLTEGAGLVIIDVNADPEFEVDATGSYTIHTLVYDPATLDLSIVELGVTTGFDVNGLLIQGGGEICASLDVAGAAFSILLCCDADAGTLSGGGEVCLDEDGTATLTATPNGDAVVPPGFVVAYALTEGEDLIILGAGANPEFEVGSAGDYTIHTLIFDPATLDLGAIVPGETTGFDINALLIQGGGEICASLDVAGAAFTVVECCLADAGTLTADAEVCYDGVTLTLTATPDGNAVVPDDFEVIYVLTESTDLVIIDVNADPEFEVEGPGAYTIHTLVYDPATLDLSIVEIGVTTGFDVNALLVQGGGEICASLDVAGAAFTVLICCDAVAGALTADEQFCYDGETLTLTATPDGNAVVPDDFEVIYVLTEGGDLVIIDVNADPVFDVEGPGIYTIHTLVYDPATLDLSIVELGETTGFDVNALLVQGGGEICASLDVAGAAFNVLLCCDADAGTLTAEAVDCYAGEVLTLTATPDGNTVVPDDFEVIYVLTEGAGLVIIDVNATPEFEVDATGSYTIHTLVYDPATLDLSIVELGVTTGFDVNGLLIQGGGEICASLDVAGAAFSVVDCCQADAGTITADEDEACIDGGTVLISAAPDGNSTVPAGYEVIYVLTEGADLVIVDVNAAPEFEVDATGDYTIHTLVYDPATLDLSIVELGVTTGFDVNGLLIQGGGEICASLDVAGAPINVVNCPPVNDECANAIALSIQLEANCPANGTIGDNSFAGQDGGEPSCDETDLFFPDVWYTFNSGDNTEVTINFDPGSMTDWVIVVSDGCAGVELACEVLPGAPFVVETELNTTYTVRVLTNLQFGDPGQFSICLTGAVSTVNCEGGEVETEDGLTSLTVCQDAVADVIEFVTSSASAENYAFLLTDEDNVIVTLLSGNSLDFNGAALGTYRVWGLSFNGTLVGATPGNPATAITATGECLELSSTFVTVSVEICTGLNGMLANNWSVYPNPGNGDFTLMYAGADADVVMELFDMGGRLVHTQRMVMTRGERYLVTMAGRLTPGMYTVQLTSNDARTNVRLMVQ
jgi:hypothetical protein